MVGLGGLRGLWWVRGSDDGKHWTVKQQVAPPGAANVVGSDLAGRPALASSIVQSLLLGAGPQSGLLALLCGLVLARHHGNIRKLLSGEESAFKRP